MSDRLEVGMALALGVGLMWGKILVASPISANIAGAFFIALGLGYDYYIDYKAGETNG